MKIIFGRGLFIYPVYTVIFKILQVDCEQDVNGSIWQSLTLMLNSFEVQTANGIMGGKHALRTRWLPRRTTTALM